MGLSFEVRREARRATAARLTPSFRRSLREDFPRRLELCIVQAVTVTLFSPEAEPELVARAKNGDREALGTLLTRYGPSLYRAVLFPRLGNAALAEQALGDTYARVVERISTFEGQPFGIYPWLRTIAFHVAIDLLRARRREVLFEPDDLQCEAGAGIGDVASSDAAELLFEQRDREVPRQKLADALARIHPRYQTAIRLRVIEERPREEVATTLGVSIATFDVVLHRAMSALRKVMTPAHPETEAT